MRCGIADGHKMHGCGAMPVFVRGLLVEPAHQAEQRGADIVAAAVADEDRLLPLVGQLPITAGIIIISGNINNIIKNITMVVIYFLLITFFILRS